MSLSERLSRLEVLRDARTAGDLAVIATQLARAEGKLLRGDPDVRWELGIVEQRIERAERRIAKAAICGDSGASGPTI
ncbi:MAG: hypothetical protein ACLPZR_20815 [Solirubrobacteraceae bacterium]